MKMSHLPSMKLSFLQETLESAGIEAQIKLCFSLLPKHLLNFTLGGEKSFQPVPEL